MVPFLLTVSKRIFTVAACREKSSWDSESALTVILRGETATSIFWSSTKKVKRVMADFFAKIDTTIMGRKTASGGVKMRKSGEMPETPGIANYVVSRRWKPGKREGFEVVTGSLTSFVKK